MTSLNNLLKQLATKENLNNDALQINSNNEYGSNANSHISASRSDKSADSICANGAATRAEVNSASELLSGLRRAYGDMHSTSDTDKNGTSSNLDQHNGQPEQPEEDNVADVSRDDNGITNSTDVLSADSTTSERCANADFLDVPVNAISSLADSGQMTSILASQDLTELSSFDDPIEYMNKIEQMPSLDELLKQFSEEAGNPQLLLTDEQKDLLSNVKKTLVELDQIVDLRLLDQSISAIMERLQDNPEVINFLDPVDMRHLIGYFDKLYSVKTTAAKVRKEKKVATKDKRVKASDLLEAVKDDDLFDFL